MGGSVVRDADADLADDRQTHRNKVYVVQLAFWVTMTEGYRVRIFFRHLLGLFSHKRWSWRRSLTHLAWTLACFSSTLLSCIAYFHFNLGLSRVLSLWLWTLVLNYHRLHRLVYILFCLSLIIRRRKCGILRAFLGFLLLLFGLRAV